MHGCGVVFCTCAPCVCMTTPAHRCARSIISSNSSLFVVVDTHAHVPIEAVVHVLYSVHGTLHVHVCVY